ncbi:MAG TPA: Asp-tRNA(Asn)/Glu-tRNA(Gln) amidotransferase GatCAB subunit A [Acidimicrobiaceae bacterium]|nr:Asp-tRNA(Asn)/Glu-tRNA(Gln) amidotransferase GatCAB subunit A [Acidimicrobiaceae bacterium]
MGLNDPSANSILEQIVRVDQKLGSMVTLDPPGLRQQWENRDQGLALGGMKIAIKDIIEVRGLPNGCGSALYGDPPEPSSSDAVVVARIREAGGVIIGKTAAHELACGVQTPGTCNPWDINRSAGGSSGGSGAAVAAGLSDGALGSDTGGSIRIPAALCGIAGLKPTYGLVPKCGVEPLSWSLDHVGPMAKTVKDCARLLQVIAGPHPADPTTRRKVSCDYGAKLDSGVAGLRLAVPEGFFMEPIDQRVQEAFFNAVETMREMGAEIVTVDVSFLSRCLDVEFAIVSPEAANYHHSSIQKRPDLIDPSIRAMLVAGAALPAGYYLRALRWRSVIADRMKAIFDEKQIDVLLTPTVPAPAQLHDQEYFDFSGIEEPVISSFVRTTAPFNLTGQPALSVPCGMTADGLPIGLQIAGRPFADDQVLRVGSAYEQATEWVSRLPPVHVSVEAG